MATILYMDHKSSLRLRLGVETYRYRLGLIGSKPKTLFRRIRPRIILGTQKGTIILTIPHIHSD